MRRQENYLLVKVSFWTRVWTGIDLSLDIYMFTKALFSSVGRSMIQCGCAWAGRDRCGTSRFRMAQFLALVLAGLRGE